MRLKDVFGRVAVYSSLAVTMGISASNFVKAYNYSDSDAFRTARDKVEMSIKNGNNAQFNQAEVKALEAKTIAFETLSDLPLTLVPILAGAKLLEKNGLNIFGKKKGLTPS